MPKDPIPITIRGITYPSRAEAAKALGITREALRRAINADRRAINAERRAINADKLETVGLNPRGKNHGREVHFNGKRYPSIAAAARAVGVSYPTMRERLKK